MVPTQESHDTWTRAGIRVWTAIGALILVALGGHVLGVVFSALVPFIIGLLIVLLRRPALWPVSHCVNRTLAVALCYLAALVLTGAQSPPMLIAQRGSSVLKSPGSRS